MEQSSPIPVMQSVSHPPALVLTAGGVEVQSPAYTFEIHIPTILDGVMYFGSVTENQY